jgi:hypothetical protein
MVCLQIDGGALCIPLTPGPAPPRPLDQPTINPRPDTDLHVARVGRRDEPWVAAAGALPGLYESGASLV